MNRRIESVDRWWLSAIAWAVALALVATSGTAAQNSEKVDVTGKWALSVESPAGASTPSLMLKQDGEKLTGKYSSQLLGDADVTGSIKGRDITFSIEGSVQGQALSVSYKGTVEGKDAMKGTVSLGGLGDGTFTAKKQ